MMVGGGTVLQYVAQADAFAFAKVFKLFPEGKQLAAAVGQVFCLDVHQSFCKCTVRIIDIPGIQEKEGSVSISVTVFILETESFLGSLPVFFFNSRHDNLVAGIDHIAEILYRITVKQTPAAHEESKG